MDPEALLSEKRNNNEENHSIIPIPNYILVLSFIILIISIFSYSFIYRTELGLSNSRIENPVDKIIKKIISTSLNFVLPKRFVVPDRFLLPPSNQMSRGTCWDFATIFLVESQYRGNGIQKGFLNEDEYTLFSKQAYGAFLGQNCLKHPEIKGCKHGGLGHHSTDDQKIAAIEYFSKYFPTLTKSILPESVCEYFPTSNDTTDYQCDGMDEAIKQNPIEFKIKGIEYATTVEGSKRLLIKKNRPIGVVVPLPSYRLYAPCDSSPYSNDPQCISKSNKCPSNYESEYCAIIKIEGRTIDGVFTYHPEYLQDTIIGGHEMDIVGFNDDWVYRSRHATTKSLANIKGAFLFHNSWRSNGHSVEYLMGRQSEENEAVICPNHRSSSNWIPTNLQCIKDNHFDISKCGTKYLRVRGSSVTKNADLLKCKNSKYCDLNRTYVLSESKLSPGDVNVRHLFTGLDSIELISWSKDLDIKTEYFEYLPFYALNLAFEPINLIENHPDLCGYWMCPYDTIDMVNRIEWEFLDHFHTVDIEFEFTDSSYQRGSYNKDLNYTLLNISTKKYNKINFNGPLPYKIVY